MFYTKESPNRTFIVYSSYGLQSHIIMNEYGVVYSVCPYVDNNKRAVLFSTSEEATEYMRSQKFFDHIAQVKFVAAVEVY